MKTTKIRQCCRAYPPSSTQLQDGLFGHRFNINRDYVKSLTVDNLLWNFRGEAALHWFQHMSGSSMHGRPLTLEGKHWGWEDPNCQLRGHFPGHWL